MITLLDFIFYFFFILIMSVVILGVYAHISIYYLK